MKGIWILLLITLFSSLPAILVFFWFRSKKYAITLPWYLVSLAAGIISFFIAALIHNLLFSYRDAFKSVLLTIFIRIALVEESSRLVTFIPLLRACKKLQHNDCSFSAALGLAAGLGFAVIESAFYGITNLQITILRLFTAAPLHGTCGIRAAAAIFNIRRNPVKALFLFASAVLIHGAYNLIIVSPAYPSVLSIIVAFAALIPSLNYLKTVSNEDVII